MSSMLIDDALSHAGVGAFQRRLIAIFGLVWAVDAMQILAIGFVAAPISKTFNITVPQALNVGTVFFLGMILGATLFGRLADQYGRRRLMVVVVLLDAVFGMISSFSSTFYELLFLRFLTGMFVGGTLPVDYIMMAEFLPTKNRGKYLVLLEGFWAIGTFVLASIVWMISLFKVDNSWRYIFFFITFPSLIGIALRFWLPESPFYLMRKGRVHEARKVIDLITMKNGRKLLPPGTRIDMKKTVSSQKLFSFEMLSRSIPVMSIWFLVSLSYYGVFIWLPVQISTQHMIGFLRGYHFLLLSVLFQIPGYAIAAYGVDKWGRKPTLFAFCLFSAIGTIGFSFSNTDIVLAISLLMINFFLLGTWAALYAFTPELFPTTLRGTAMGASGAMARLGGLLAPFLLSFAFSGYAKWAIGFLAVLLFCAALAVLSIDTETKSLSLE
ncbi:MFS transporter [Liberibacter crescens]|uniref:MFS transporter n=1 Tax=Liberibacter crescens TaxID=1273132 RepID=UPI000762F229|nr:MFS transporter [Liberibacter crescens]AMC12884.1 MFS transporter [Liberibacter crescens]